MITGKIELKCFLPSICLKIHRYRDLQTCFYRDDRKVAWLPEIIKQKCTIGRYVCINVRDT